MSDLRIRGDVSSSRRMQVLPKRFLQRIRQKFGIQDEAVSFELSKTINVTVPSDPDRTEESYLLGERIIGNAFSLDAGGATNDNQVGVWLPNDLQIGTVATLDRIHLASATPALLFVSTAEIIEGLVSPFTAQPFQWRDMRGPTLAPFVSTAEITSALRDGIRLRGGFRVTAGPSPITGAFQRTLSVGDNDVGIVLMPGWGIVIQNRTADTILDVSLEGRERAIDQTEVFLNRTF